MGSLSLLWANLTFNVNEYLSHTFGDNVTVRTKTGLVRGYKSRTNYGYEYLNFQGVPYAKPPIGDLRFKAPEPYEATNPEKVINAETSLGGPAAWQCQMTGKVIGDEDCLHLAIYTRNTNPTTKKPVMVWIHGGGYMFGTNYKSSYDPAYLLRHDIVFVVVNFRLGCLGFASFEDPEVGVPGNAGMKDQTMALRWINQNIKYFGGDPNNIMLSGCSAGSVMVSGHMMSNLSKGLFHKAYMSSGNAIVPWTLTPAVESTKRIARYLGWDGSGGDKGCLKFLKSASPKDICIAQRGAMSKEELETGMYPPFGPVVEPYDSPDCFFNKRPAELMRSAWGSNIPVVISNVSDEGLTMHTKAMKSLQSGGTFEEGLTYVDPFRSREIEQQTYQDVRNQIQKYYFGYTDVGPETILSFMKFYEDGSYVHAAHREILSRLKNRCAPTYLMRFSVDTDFNIMKKSMLFVDIPGAFHGDDVVYFIRSYGLTGRDPPQDSLEWKTIERMTDCVTSFAKTGDPNNQTIAPARWEPVALERAENGQFKYKCFEVADELRMIDLPQIERMHFWDRIYEQLNEPII